MSVTCTLVQNCLEKLSGFQTVNFCYVEISCRPIAEFSFVTVYILIVRVEMSKLRRNSV